MKLSGRTIKELGIVRPHYPRTRIALWDDTHVTYGESYCGYDIRVDSDYALWPLQTTLAASVEEFCLPNNVVGVVHDKSSWARRGISVQNTVLEPGWRGFLTLELLYCPLKQTIRKDLPIIIQGGMPIAQVMFEYIDDDTEGYQGKYQDQQSGPQEAR
jgi:dCTP deaminase